MSEKKILWKDDHLYSKKAKRIVSILCCVTIISIAWAMYQTFYINGIIQSTCKIINSQSEIMQQITKKQGQIDAVADYMSALIGNEEDEFALSKLRELYILGYELNFSSDELLRLLRFIYKTSIENGVNPEIIFYMANTESGWNPNAISNKNAMGLLQILPSTAKICDNVINNQKLLDPFYNVYVGIKWYRMLLIKHGGNNHKALTEYWAGETSMNKSPYSENILNSLDKMEN